MKITVNSNCGLMAMYLASKGISNWQSLKLFRQLNREMHKTGVYSCDARNFLTRKAIASYNSCNRTMPTFSFYTNFKYDYLF